MNIVALTGRLTADPELRSTQTGVFVTRFNIAVQRAYKNGNERKTDFITIVAWRNTADFICKYFRKGQLIAIDGAIETSSYEDRDGNKRTSFVVNAQNVSFCGSKKRTTVGADSSEPTNDGTEIPPLAEQAYPDDDELPF